jgi:pimeloyl-ACP methyl ester carboxylesterase
MPLSHEFFEACNWVCLAAYPSRCRDRDPHPRFEVLGHAGHCLHIEQPDKAAKMIEEFIAG